MEPFLCSENILMSRLFSIKNRFTQKTNSITVTLKSHKNELNINIFLHAAQQYID